MSAQDLIRKLEAASGPDEELALSLCRLWQERNDYADIAMHIMHALAGDGLVAVGHATALVEKMLHTAHPGMTMKLDMCWSGRDLYTRAEITWPSTERYGRARLPANAIMSALISAVEETDRQLAPYTNDRKSIAARPGGGR